MFENNNKKQDGKLTRDEFLNFYFNACFDAAKSKNVIENALHNFVRVDLQQIRDVY